MKFGKEFAAQMVPEWHPAYMDYNFLKLMLKDLMRFRARPKPILNPPTGGLKKALTFRAFSGLMRRDGNGLHSPRNEEEIILVKNMEQDGKDSYETMFLMSAEEGGEYDVVFFKRLDEELNKVNAFYRSRVEELVKEAAVLDKQMSSLVAFRAIARSKPGQDFKTTDVEAAPKTTPTPERYSGGPAQMEVINEDETETDADGTIQTERMHGRAERKKANEIEMSSLEFETPRTKSAPAERQIRQKLRSNNKPHPIEIIRDVKSNNRPHPVEIIRDVKSNNRPHPAEIIRDVKIKITPDTPRSTIRGILNNPEGKTLSRKDLRRGNEMVRDAFIEFYQKLALVKSFSSLNLLAFSKIMKKYDKITGRRASLSYLSVVEKSYLISSEEVNRLLERVEETFTKHFATGNHSKAVKILRPTRKRQKHRVTFLIGFFTGCSIALLIALILLIVVRNVYNDNGATRYMEAVFPLYSMLGFGFLHMFMYAANLYFWRRFRINYPFIFGFKPGTELGFREVFLITTGISVMSLAGAISNLHMDTRSLSTLGECVPLILVVILLLALFCPFKVFYYSSRIFLLRSAFHCICVPFYKVSLPDFFLADQLTSQVEAIRIFEYFICYYSTGDFKSRTYDCRQNDVYQTFYFILAVIPYWMRFLQCMRRLVEERDAMQGYNALKYFSTIVAVVMRTAYSQTGHIGWRIMSFLTSSIATVVSTYWDLVIDWGLLQRNSQNPWLRDKLVIEQKSIYFIAMILNVLLRFAWLQSVMKFKISRLHLKATVAIFACLEIIRRGIWNFFRLENEHLNNVGKYRAFKSVPLPFQYIDDENDE